MNKAANDDQKEPKSFKEIKEFLEMQSNNLDVMISKAPPSSVDARLAYLLQSNQVMGTALFYCLELLSQRHDVNIQIASEVPKPRG